MISNPKHGWCNFKLGDFEGHPSYLTDVPLDLINAFLNYYTQYNGVAWFDEEGTDFTFVINPYNIYIVEERQNTILHYFPDINVDELAKELIKDIENDLNGWANFIPDDEWEEIVEHDNEIRNGLHLLKETFLRQKGIEL